MSLAKKALERVRDELHRAVKDLDPVEYREVLETLEDDVKASLEALAIEDEERDEGVDPDH